MATLAAPLARVEDLLDPNVVKVVADAQGRALCISAARRSRGIGTVPAPASRASELRRRAPAHRHLRLSRERAAATGRARAHASRAAARSWSSCGRWRTASRSGSPMRSRSAGPGRQHTRGSRARREPPARVLSATFRANLKRIGTCAFCSSVSEISAARRAQKPSCAGSPRARRRSSASKWIQREPRAITSASRPMSARRKPRAARL